MSLYMCVYIYIYTHCSAEQCGYTVFFILFLFFSLLWNNQSCWTAVEFWLFSLSITPYCGVVGLEVFIDCFIWFILRIMFYLSSSMYSQENSKFCEKQTYNLLIFFFLIWNMVVFFFFSFLFTVKIISLGEKNWWYLNLWSFDYIFNLYAFDSLV